MNLLFFHGWSTTHTRTYGVLPEALVREAAAAGLQLSIAHVHLGKYISFVDAVTLDDLATALNRALTDLLGKSGKIAPFSCITHSTGGPLLRYWVEKYYGANGLENLPLQHLLMLAPANHGSPLAVLGKSKVGRIKAWFSGVEPGEQILNWLSLGSEGQWALNQASLSYRSAAAGFYPFVFAGQGIDEKLYDFLNPYLVEPGSDGVVRVAGANMNCRYLHLTQSNEPVAGQSSALALNYDVKKAVRTPQKVPLAVFHQHSHSGSKMGIMRAKSLAKPGAPLVDTLLACLKVNDAHSYRIQGREMQALTKAQQQLKPVGQSRPISRYSTLVFRVRDHLGRVIKHQDYDILLLAGKRYSPNVLPKGFFVDRQVNKRSQCVIYYVDAEKMAELANTGNYYGLRVVVRPELEFAGYRVGEFHSEGLPVDSVFAPNETTYIDIVMNRYVDAGAVSFDPAKAPRSSFKRSRPRGQALVP
ncbi:MAG: phospholipase [Gammaproteobacteria bacterium]|nr:MAG: phospholipase [Gammaproteobacteria bacterium]